ncbi:MAG: hypothetical protein QXN33_03570, partial [Candidatus Bathyarchaeia archaeon]
MLEEASELALEELDHFLRLRAIARGRYETVLRAAAGLGDASWSDMKLALQAREGREINDRNFTAILKNLLDSGFLIKDGGRHRIPIRSSDTPCGGDPEGRPEFAYGPRKAKWGDYLKRRRMRRALERLQESRYLIGRENRAVLANVFIAHVAP